MKKSLGKKREEFFLTQKKTNLDRYIGCALRNVLMKLIGFFYIIINKLRKKEVEKKWQAREIERVKTSDRNMV